MVGIVGGMDRDGVERGKRVEIGEGVVERGGVGDEERIGGVGDGSMGGNVCWEVGGVCSEGGIELGGVEGGVKGGGKGVEFLGMRERRRGGVGVSGGREEEDGEGEGM